MKNTTLRKLVKFTLVFSLCVLAKTPFLCYSQNQPATSGITTPPEKEKSSPATSEAQPHMVLERTDHDAGTVYEGTLVTHSFTVKNKGKADLLINKVSPG